MLQQDDLLSCCVCDSYDQRVNMRRPGPGGLPESRCGGPNRGSASCIIILPHKVRIFPCPSTFISPFHAAKTDIEMMSRCCLLSFVVTTCAPWPSQPIRTTINPIENDGGSVRTMAVTGREDFLDNETGTRLAIPNARYHLPEGPGLDKKCLDAKVQAERWCRGEYGYDRVRKKGQRRKRKDDVGGWRDGRSCGLVHSYMSLQHLCSEAGRRFATIAPEHHGPPTSDVPTTSRRIRRRARVRSDQPNLVHAHRGQLNSKTGRHTLRQRPASRKRGEGGEAKQTP